jgi:hypothetical protein
MSGARFSLTAGKPRLELVRNDIAQPATLKAAAQGPAGRPGVPGGPGPQGLQGFTGLTGTRGIPGDTTNKVLAANAILASKTGNTTETALATIAIPAGYMGAQGRLRITTLWTVTSSANNKTIRTRFGGMSGTIYQSRVVTTVGVVRSVVEIENRGAANSQVGGPTDLDSYGTSTGAVVTSSVDTAAASTDLCITAQLANGTETMTLQAYAVELLMPPAQAQIGLYFGGDGIIIDPVTFEVKVNRANVAPLASPAFTGTPTAPTPSGGTNSTQIATTAFVQSLLAALSTVYAPFNVTTLRAHLGLGSLALLNVVTWGLVDATLKAAIGDLRSGADQKFLTPKVAFDAQAYVPLTDAATIAVDFNAGFNFSVTLTANRILGFPTNPKVGQSGFIDVTEPGAGAKTLAFAAGYTFDGGLAPAIDLVANRTSSLYYHVRSGSEVRIGMAFKGVRATP